MLPNSHKKWIIFRKWAILYLLQELVKSLTRKKRTWKWIYGEYYLKLSSLNNNSWRIKPQSIYFSWHLFVDFAVTSASDQPFINVYFLY